MTAGGAGSVRAGDGPGRSASCRWEAIAGVAAVPRGIRGWCIREGCLGRGAACCGPGLVQCRNSRNVSELAFPVLS
jgi:hypothetical protein